MNWRPPKKVTINSESNFNSEERVDTRLTGIQETVGKKCWSTEVNVKFELGQ